VSSHPLIVDCDPGQNDAIALLLALAPPELEVLGITTVAGNVPYLRTA
jgi:purine nucleosidase